VPDELERAPAEKRDKMITLIDKYGIEALQVNNEIRGLANIYIQHGLIPERFEADSVHIAVATFNDLDMIISMNFSILLGPVDTKLLHGFAAGLYARASSSQFAHTFRYARIAFPCLGCVDILKVHRFLRRFFADYWRFFPQCAHGT
jgi:hypothetical protein